MRRFVLGWKTLGYAQRFRAEIVNYADDLCVVSKAPAAEVLAAVERLMERLKLPVNERKTRCLRCPEEAFEYLGYRVGRNYRASGRGWYIGTRPSKGSVQGIVRKVSEMTAKRYTGLPVEVVVERINQAVYGWARYFSLGQVTPAYRAVNKHTAKRLRRWLCSKHKVKSGQHARFPEERLRELGLFCLTRRTMGLPKAKA